MSCDSPGACMRVESRNAEERVEAEDRWRFNCDGLVQGNWEATGL